VKGGVVCAGGATAVDVADSLKMADCLETVVLEGKLIGGGKIGLRYMFFI
jgi:hypothetical protein